VGRTGFKGWLEGPGTRRWVLPLSLSLPFHGRPTWALHAHGVATRARAWDAITHLQGLFNGPAWVLPVNMFMVTLCWCNCTTDSHSTSTCSPTASAVALLPPPVRACACWARPS
jgi:hypothetical protein